jgi:hypothetical protein
MRGPSSLAKAPEEMLDASGRGITGVPVRTPWSPLWQRGIGREAGAAFCCRESEGVPRFFSFIDPPRLGARGLKIECSDSLSQDSVVKSFQRH